MFVLVKHTFYTHLFLENTQLLEMSSRLSSTEDH